MPRRFTSAGLALLLVLLGAALVFLAVLQYRWIGEVSAGEEQRARAALDLAGRQFADELERHVGRVVNTFQGIPDEDQLPQRMHEWQTTSPEPSLIHAVYISDAGALQRFNPETRQLVAAEWPPELVPIRERMRVPLRQQHRPATFDERTAILEGGRQ